LRRFHGGIFGRSPPPPAYGSIAEPSGRRKPHLAGPGVPFWAAAKYQPEPASSFPYESSPRQLQANAANAQTRTVKIFICY
jgi:hypothetical protein